MTELLIRSARAIALEYGEGNGTGDSPWSNRAQRRISVAKAGLTEAGAAIAIATTRQTIGFAIEAIALLAANRDWPCVLIIDFGIAACEKR